MEGPPHILLVTCHDIGRRLGCYGHDVATPAVDRLAQQGVRYSAAFAAAPQCSPSRAALATGRHPVANGVMGLAHLPFGWDLHTDEKHVAGRLASAGYATHLFGHQHVTLDIHRLGFGELHDIHDRACDPAEQVAASVEQWSRSHNQSNSTRPQYVEVNLDEPHRPYRISCTDSQQLQQLRVPEYLPDIPEVREDLADLEETIREADRAIGRVADAVHAATPGVRWLVVITADHGIAFPRAKCTLYDPGLEIPLILVGPAIPQGVVCDGLVSNVDIVPTLLEAAGVVPPPDVHGISLWSSTDSWESTSRRAIYASKTYHSYYDPMRCVRTNRWKLIRNFESRVGYEMPDDVRASRSVQSDPSAFDPFGTRPEIELYDLAADPGEHHNLADDPSHGSERESLVHDLFEWMRAVGDPILTGPIPSPP